MHCQTLVIVALVVGCGSGASLPPAPVTKAPVVTTAVVPAPAREDFESATAGSMPPGWAVAGDAKNIVFSAASGDTGTVLQIVTTDEGAGSIKRSLDVAPYRGKRLRLAVRGACEKGVWSSHGFVGIELARPALRRYEDRVRTERIEAAAWQTYAAVIDVAADATGLELVIGARGTSKVTIDDIALTVIGDAGAGDEAPSALEGRALENVVAFARLYGVVRYFHPSDEVAALDGAAWDRFVTRGVRTVENAADAAALRARLEQLFAPIAPSASIHLEGERVQVAAIDGTAVHWIHHGIGISKSSVYRSSRGTSDASTRATIKTTIDPALVRGKEIKVTLHARGTLASENADAGLWIAERRADGKRGFYSEPEMQPAIGATWTEISVQGKIAEDAAGLALGVQLIGDADVWFETPVVTVDGRAIAIAAWGTPPAKFAASWSLSGGTFTAAVDDKGCEKRRACLHVSPEPVAPPDLRPWHGGLGGGVAATVPLELPTRNGKTVPAARASLPSSDSMPLLASDRATRLAAVVVAWNVFEHFYPYFDVRGIDWLPELPLRLGEAARDDGTGALHTTLRRLVHALHDGHGSVGHPSEDRSWTAPWLWERVEGKLVITQVADLCACDLAPGDIVTAIDGEPTKNAMAAAGALRSAATEQFRDYFVLRRLGSGPEGGRRTLDVERAGVAHHVEVALVDPPAAPIEKRPASGDEIAPGIRYVNIDQVTTAQWTKILPDLATAKAVVVDMRGYPNQLPLGTPLAHFTNKPLRSAQWQIPTPARPDRVGMTFAQSSWMIEPAAPFIGNVVFLTDGRAVSAAETFMGIVEAYKLGPIVGSATAGTNGNINPFSIPGGYTLSWTGMKVLKHDGSRHHGVGILPTVPAARTLAGVAARRDEVLEKGIAVAQQLRARRRR